MLTLSRLFLTTSSSRRSERLWSLASAFLLPISVIFSSVQFTPLVILLAPPVSGLAFLPAARFARSFWLGTDQLRSHLSVLASSAPTRALFYLTLLVSFAASLLWIEPLMPYPVTDEVKLLSLAVSAVLQLFSVRAAVQMYLNEAVFCWYQRLHASRVPEMDYGRAKLFLHNHHLCTVATQLVALPVVVLLLLGLARLPGNLFQGVAVLDGLAIWSDGVKEAALFLAWWIVFSWSVLVVVVLACYRRGWLLVS